MALIVVYVNDRMVEVKGSAIGAATLREIAGIPEDHDLWQDVPGLKDDVLVDKSATIYPPVPLRFYTTPRVITGG